MVNDIKMENQQTTFSNYTFEYDTNIMQAVQQFQAELKEKLNVNQRAFCYVFQFILETKFAKQQYKIEITKECCKVYAKSKVGFYYATRTLAQLLNVKIGEKVDTLTLPCMTINDRPRFKFRSFMIDEVRHFFGKEEIKKIIDLMADLKFNYFHWHLSDDQGFRINFKEFDRLQPIAAKRARTKINAITGNDYEEKEYHYWYEESDIKEIIAYAKAKYIEIIPEIDMPGHTTALVAAYNELHCLHHPVEVETGFGVFSEIVCPSKSTTYDFFKKLLKALCRLFKSSHYIHIGGDEVDAKTWAQCPDCQKKMQDLHLHEAKELQQYFMQEMVAYVQSLNKKVICWHDGIYASSHPEVIMQYWTWQMDQPKIQLINQGRSTIYSPCSQFYFNDPYAELPLKTTYCKKIRFEGLNRTGLSHIIGIEGCIWTEWIDSCELLETLILPRLEALAEKGWTKQKNLNFKDFLNRLERHYPVLENMHFSYTPTKIALSANKKNREKISKAFRDNDKKVEFKRYLRWKKKHQNEKTEAMKKL